MKKTLVVISVLLCLVLGFWYFAVPEQVLLGVIESSLTRAGLYPEIEGFKKGLFYGIGIERLTIVKEGRGNGGTRPLIVLETIEGKLDLPSLFRLSPSFGFECDAHGGRIEGKVSLTGTRAFAVHGRDIRIDELTFLRTWGIDGSGSLSGTLRIEKENGEARFSIPDAKLKATTLGGLYFPLDLFHEIRVALLIKGKALEINSFTLQGDGVRARVKGTIREGELLGAAEVMPDASFAAGAVLDAALGQYRASPGYYVMPIRINLRKVVNHRDTEAQS